MPHALIDFDTLAPGLRLWGMGYSAFSWLAIGNDEYSGKEQIRRMGLFLNAYAVQSYSIQQLAAFMVARQSALATWSASEGKSQIADWAATVREWTMREIMNL
jgi:aminoglycoside phosphotransferase (APT) family kinase protein